MDNKNYVIYTDKKTHIVLSVWAAKRQISIKQVLKELVEEKQKQETNK